jgi:hypothetical protein
MSGLPTDSDRIKEIQKITRTFKADLNALMKKHRAEMEALRKEFVSERLAALKTSIINNHNSQ